MHRRLGHAVRPMKSVSSHPVLTTPFIEVEERPKLVRRRTTTDCLFTELTHSPLHDLAPVATLGLTTRVTHSNSVAVSLDQLGLAFEPQRDSTLILVQGGYTAALVKAAGTAVLCALMYGFHLGNMNPAAPAMRADLGIEAGVENDNAWAFCVSIFCLGAPPAPPIRRHLRRRPACRPLRGPPLRCPPAPRGLPARRPLPLPRSRGRDVDGGGQCRPFSCPQVRCSVARWFRWWQTRSAGREAAISRPACTSE